MDQPRFEPKLCECGCGQITNRCDRAFKKRGYLKGEYRRFIAGHAIRVPENGIKTRSGRGDLHGENNPSWKGDLASKQAGRIRATKLYELGKCERCSKQATERHHKDGNPLNNAPENINVLCRNCHMIVDGRSTGKLKGLKKGKVR